MVVAPSGLFAHAVGRPLLASSKLKGPLRLRTTRWGGLLFWGALRLRAATAHAVGRPLLASSAEATWGSLFWPSGATRWAGLFSWPLLGGCNGACIGAGFSGFLWLRLRAAARNPSPPSTATTMKGPPLERLPTSKTDRDIDAMVQDVFQNGDGRHDLRSIDSRHGAGRSASLTLNNVGRHKACSSCGMCVVRRTCPCTHYMCYTTM